MVVINLKSNTVYVTDENKQTKKYELDDYLNNHINGCRYFIVNDGSAILKEIAYKPDPMLSDCIMASKIRQELKDWGL